MDYGYIADNTFQLHKGETCFIYKSDYIVPIIKRLWQKYNELIKVEKIEDYWVLRPIKKGKKVK